jgi:uncharacterized membrane-anchored protein
MINSAETVLKEGTVYKFKPQPIDPYDAFRGRYITLNFGNLRIDSPNAVSNFSADQIVYVLLAEDEEGFAYFSQITAEVPNHENYMTTNIRSVGEDYVYIYLPENMGRYYLNEKLAPLAESAYRKLTRENANGTDEVPVYLDVKVYDGIPLIEEMYMKGMPMVEYLRSVENLEKVQ